MQLLVLIHLALDTLPSIASLTPLVLYTNSPYLSYAPLCFKPWTTYASYAPALGLLRPLTPFFGKCILTNDYTVTPSTWP